MHGEAIIRIYTKMYTFSYNKTENRHLRMLDKNKNHAVDPLKYAVYRKREFHSL